MGLFSKLLGDAGEKLLKEAAGAVKKAAAEKKQAQTNASKPDTWDAPAAEPSWDEPVSEAPAFGPSGDSWGPVMPAEECQFNYGGTFAQYFDHVFREDFPQYRLEREQVSGDTLVYTFWQGPSKALVVEVLPQSSARQKLRRDSLRAGIPYLRFYHNHDGWWNTRSYVDRRVKTALGI